MHAILFAIKRTFHKSVWFGRFLLKSYALTPSRFDILFMLQQTGGRGGLWQSRIREILGVARITVSRMIVALERLGYIRRERSRIDARQFEVWLTKHGQRTIARATKTILQSGIIAHVVVYFVCPQPEVPEATLRDLVELEYTLNHMRERLLDEATMFYPWHPED